MYFNVFPYLDNQALFLKVTLTHQTARLLLLHLASEENVFLIRGREGGGGHFSVWFNAK